MNHGVVQDSISRNFSPVPDDTITKSRAASNDRVITNNAVGSNLRIGLDPDTFAQPERGHKPCAFVDLNLFRSTRLLALRESPSSAGERI